MAEHYEDRWRRLGITPKIREYTDGGCWYGERRNALRYSANPVTELRKCDLCGKVSTPKKVQHRPLVWRWDKHKNDYSDSKSTLCMGCWNKTRRLVERQEKLDELIKLQRKILREVAKHGKND